MSVLYENLLEDFNLPLKTTPIFCVLSDYFQIPVKLYVMFREERRDSMCENIAQTHHQLPIFTSYQASSGETCPSLPSYDTIAYRNQNSLAKISGPFQNFCKVAYSLLVCLKRLFAIQSIFFSKGLIISPHASLPSLLRCFSHFPLNYNNYKTFFFPSVN